MPFRSPFRLHHFRADRINQQVDADDFRDEHFFWHDVLFVELDDETLELFGRFPVEREEGDVTLNHLAATHIEHLDTHPAPVERVAEHVARGRVGRDHILFVHNRFDGPDLVTELGGTLELHLLGGLAHIDLELGERLGRLPVQEPANLLDDRFLVVRIDGELTRPEALSDMVIQAELTWHRLTLP